jgi:hypothetical protein
MKKSVTKKPETKKSVLKKSSSGKPVMQTPAMKKHEMQSLELETLGEPTPETQMPVRQKWEHARVFIKASEAEGPRDYFVHYLTPAEEYYERPKPTEIYLPGIPNPVIKDPPDNSEAMMWIYTQIRKLGNEGWELVSAPSMDFLALNNTPLFRDYWMLWFKRPHE